MLKRLLLLTTIFTAAFAFAAFLYFAFVARPDLEVLLERSRATIREPRIDNDRLLSALRDLDVVVEFSAESRPEILKEALRWRAQAHRRAQSFQSAEEDLRRVLERIDPNDRACHFDLVETFLAAGRQLGDLTYLERAAESMNAWREDHPNDMQAIQVLGRTQFEVAGLLADHNDVVVDSLIDGPTTFTLIQRLRDFTLRPSTDPELRTLEEEMRGALQFVVSDKREEILDRAERARRTLETGIGYLYQAFWNRPHLRNAMDLLEALALIGRESEILVLAPVLLHPAYPEDLSLPPEHPFTRRVMLTYAEALRKRGFLARARDLLERHRAEFEDFHARREVTTLLDIHLQSNSLELLERLVTTISENPIYADAGWWNRYGSYYTGSVHALAKRWAEAIPDLETFIRQNRQNVRAELARLQEAHRMLARAYLSVGRDDDANRTFGALAQLAEKPGETLFELARLTLDEFELPREAGRLLVLSVKEEPALSARAPELIERVALAMLRDIGISLENAARQATPGAGGLRFEPAVEWLAARFLLEEGSTRDAVRLVDQLLARHPDFHPAVLLRARGLVSLGQRDRAISNYRAYLEFVPEDDAAWLELSEFGGRGLRVRGVNFAEVRFRALRHSLRGSGGLQLGVDLIERDQLDRALKLVSPERLEGDDAARARLVLARAARDMAPTVAAGLLDAIPEDSTYKIEATLERLRLAARIDTDENVERLALEVSPETPLAPSALAETIATLVRHRRPKAAYALLRRAEPKDLGSTYFRLLGLTQIALGKKELGEASLDRALAFRDSSAVAAGLDLVLELRSEGRLQELATVVPLIAFISRDERDVFQRKALAYALALAGQARPALDVFDAIAAPVEREDRTDFEWTRDVIASLVPEAEEETTSSEAPGDDSRTKPRKPREPDAPWLLEYPTEERYRILEFLALEHAGARTGEFLERVSTLLQEHPNSLPLRWWFVKAQLANERYLEAAQAEQVLLLENPEFEPALELLENTLARVGRRKAALAIHAARLLMAARSERPSVANVVELAEPLLVAGEGVAVTQAILELPPSARDAAPIRLLGARLLNQAGDHATALRTLRPLWTQAITNPRTDDETLLPIGRQYLTSLLGTESIGFPEIAQVVSTMFARDARDPFLLVLSSALDAHAKPLGSMERDRSLDAAIDTLWDAPVTLQELDPVATRVLFENLERSLPHFFERVLWVEMCKAPAQLDLWLRRAEFLERIGNERAALEEYRKLHELRVLPEATVGLVRLRIRYAPEETEEEELLRLLDREIDRKANETKKPALLALRIDLLRSLGRFERALREVERTEEERPRSPELREAALLTWFEARLPEAFSRAVPLIEKNLPQLPNEALPRLLRLVTRR